ncbi:MAG: transglutaminase family protein [Candidatus Faecousia sp.]|nr:transglutaminase family protein [Candidatus Faecousia sp.]
MKGFLFSYKLNISLDAPVQDHCFTLRCLPQSDTRQRIKALEYMVTPSDFLSLSKDQWGNLLVYGSFRGESSAFRVEVNGVAETGLSPWVPAIHPERDRIFAIPTSMTAPDSVLTEYAAIITGEHPLESAEQVMALLHTTMHYVPGSTNIHTTAAQAFRQGQGVCQDFAHVMLALLRLRGIPCRYVTGMLPGEGRSHAWVEVLFHGGWYGFDPTNLCSCAGEYIKLSHGRDAQDCAINRGIFRGGANQISEESVIVTER